MRATSLVVLLGLLSGASAARYAVLIAGSSGYGNYRHQADVCHAYQVLTKGGVPKDNVITLMADDVAHSDENPFPGKLFNAPTSGPGEDVYAGCKIDYRGDDVTPEIFAAVLTGDRSVATGRVLTSGADDDVFVNFVDHGGPGLIGFPSTIMHAEDLLAALKTMHERKMYKQLVFYLEACESGSMFEKLPSDLNIYATTASNAQESSWGTYCPPHDKVDGKEINSCLGDLYSVNWMQNADATNLNKETLEAQYKVVRKATTKSHVMQFGTMNMTSEEASAFEGRGDTGARAATDAPPSSHMNARDADVVSTFYTYLNAEGDRKDLYAERLIQEVQARQRADKTFAAIRQRVAGSESLPEVSSDFQPCYKPVHTAVEARCGPYTGYSMKHAKTVAQLCRFTGGKPGPVVAAVEATCNNSH